MVGRTNGQMSGGGGGVTVDDLGLPNSIVSGGRDVSTLSLNVEADKLYVVVIAGINWYGDRVTGFNFSGVQVEKLTSLIKYSISGGATYGAVKQLIKTKGSGRLTIGASYTVAPQNILMYVM